MSCEISEALKRLAAEYEHATTQKVRDRLWRQILRVSYKKERDRYGAHRRDTDIGRFEASMLSLDDPSVRRTEKEDSPAWESDGGKGADAVVVGADGALASRFDPKQKKWMLNKLRRHSDLQRTLRSAIRAAAEGSPIRIKRLTAKKSEKFFFANKIKGEIDVVKCDLSELDEKRGKKASLER